MARHRPGSALCDYVIMMRAGTDKWFSGQGSQLVAAQLSYTHRCAVMGVAVKCVCFAPKFTLGNMFFVKETCQCIFQVFFFFMTIKMNVKTS